ncbi:hypothetical protein BD779DRAFT_1438361, partial [Infundibulicybe gibba]
GKAAFVCEREGKETSPIPGGDEFNVCPKCRPPFEWDRTKPHRLLEHVGGHILFDSSLDSALEWCGLCMRLSPLCIFYLRKGKGAASSAQIDMERSRCPNLLKFSYRSAASSTSLAPCSNVPISCPLCASDLAAVWKYNMKAHFSKHHPSQHSKDILMSS